MTNFHATVDRNCMKCLSSNISHSVALQVAVV